MRTFVHPTVAQCSTRRYADGMLQVTPNIAIAERDIHESFVQASGPGGQNVNKVATAVQLRFDVRNSSGLPDAVRSRLLRLAGGQISDDGVLIIKASRFRTQERNRQDARERLLQLIRAAAKPPKARRPTNPTRASQEQRLASKRHRGATKSGRRMAPRLED
jgi:ribosome-associated protein